MVSFIFVMNEYIIKINNYKAIGERFQNLVRESWASWICLVYCTIQNTSPTIHIDLSLFLMLSSTHLLALSESSVTTPQIQYGKNRVCLSCPLICLFKNCIWWWSYLWHNYLHTLWGPTILWHQQCWNFTRFSWIKFFCCR